MRGGAGSFDKVMRGDGEGSCGTRWGKEVERGCEGHWSRRKGYRTTSTNEKMYKLDGDGKRFM